MTRIVAVVLAGMVASGAAQQLKQAPVSNLTRPNSVSRADFEAKLKVAIDNPEVKVFRLELPPHGSAPVGREMRDYVLVSVSGGSVEVGGAGNSFRLDMAAGEPVVLKGGWPHTIRSRSERETRWVLVETAKALEPEKAECGLGGPNCTKFRFGKTDEGEYDESLLFETNSVRLSRLQLGRATNLPTHRDRLDHVVVPLTDCRLEVNGGEVSPTAGESIWVRGGFPEFRNTGGQPVRMVMVEIK